jgi:uncharacterized protein (TIGR04222 family)
MDFLFNNSLANMNGPLFLIFYAIFSIFVLVGLWLMKKRLDWTNKLPVPNLPNSFDSFEVAYLRGGENEFSRAVIFSLIQKKFLQISEANYISFRQQQPNWTILSQIEKTALPWFQESREIKEVFNFGGLNDILRCFSEVFEEKFTKNNFIFPFEVIGKIRIFQGLALFLIISLGVYKIVVATQHGKTNIIFLIIMMIVFSLITFKVAKTDRLSALGKNYLEKLQNTFQDYRKISGNYQLKAELNSIDTTLFAFGLFGVSALSSTLYPEYQRAFNVSSSGSGSCGSSCGSGSSCSSGGDSGGDGGGCGGGCGGCS